ncbi:MAG: hypothetical protein MRERV_33c007 [Mycoplasmataceae bacterium RV_VA103A]|nr:MAG: hypothetical protein MRERV_33c007 [Mycoplasmataceae bacterium RV_VA103A]
MRSQKINELVKSFAEVEKEQGWTNVSTKKTFTLQEEKNLDTLARLLTGEETCVAVFLSSEDQLIIASNRQRPTYAPEYLELLRKFIKDSIEDKLIEKAIDQIYMFNLKNSARQDRLFRLSEFHNFKSLIEDYKESGAKDLKSIQEAAKSVFKEFKENKIEGSYWEYLLPLEDTNLIINAIKEEKGEWKRIIEAIEKSKVEFISDRECQNRFSCGCCEECKRYGGKSERNKLKNCERPKSCRNCDICLNNQLHAEMKIINELFYKKGSQAFGGEKGYIGITKLCCMFCQTMMDVINSKRRENFLTCGTHGKAYENWIAPSFYQQELLESLKREMKWESTSEISLQMKLTETSFITGTEISPK